MELGAQVRQRRRPAAEVLSDGAGLQTAQPQPHPRCRCRHRLQQVDQALAVFQVLAPGGDLDAGQHNLPVARRFESRRLLRRLIQGQ